MFHPLSTESLSPKRRLIFWRSLLLASLFGSTVQAIDYADGVMSALPLKEGKPPVIDGEFEDWDLSGQEPVLISAQSAETMNAEWAVMYDNDALYFSANVRLPDRPLYNPNNPHDAFWSGDILQVRIATDPALPYPLDRSRDKESDRVLHISFWKNHLTGKPFIHINRGVGFDKGSSVLPEGSEVVIKEEGSKSYRLEAKIPWAALGSPDGKNPFKPGSSTACIIESLWVGGDKSRAALCYRVNPGVFGFQRPNNWGKIIFEEKSLGKRRRPSLTNMINTTREALTAERPKIGVPITITVPKAGLKTSVNIVDKNGTVLREVIGAETLPKGKNQVYWDGRDAFGKELSPGTYSWAAYFHEPLVAEFQGGAGSSGNPYWNTIDRKGAWGGDHTDPIDSATEGDFLYLLWPVSEAGKALVKTDLNGKVEWRNNPFVGGGFGSFFGVAATDKYVYLSRRSSRGVPPVTPEAGEDVTFLVRLDAKTGALLTWGSETGPSELPIYKSPSKPVPKESTPVSIPPLKKEDQLPPGTTLQANGMGLAVGNGKIYMGAYGLDTIFVLDEATGAIETKLPCPGVRGISLDTEGNLWAVSYVPGNTASIVRFNKASGEPQVVINSDLEAPFDLAVNREGEIAVSDLGKAHQVKVFSPTGKLLKAIGKEGGRAWQGRYLPEESAFLNPSGLSFDKEGAIVIGESAPPKVFSRITKDGTILKRLYGPGVYWNATWPMPEDPRNVFYLLGYAVGRATIAGPNEVGVPNAYWNPARAGYPQVGDIEGMIPHPETIRGKNGELYFVKDSGVRFVAHLKDDIMLPFATFERVMLDAEKGKPKRNAMSVWMDSNGDNKVQEEEKTLLETLPDGTPFPSDPNATSSLHMEANGDLYFVTNDNNILKLPAEGFEKNGQIRWDLKKFQIAIPEILPGVKKMASGFRGGSRGVRLDSKGNLYTLFNYALPGKGGEYDFATPAVATQMKEGMGHTSGINVVKFAKFNPEGKLLWMAGRKATAGAAPGEMYHFWNMAGIANDRYIAGGSEWGQIYLYTHDGFFVDALMNNPGDVAPPGPYTFGGETSGGRIAYFEKSGELWAYNSGMTYKVRGFSNGAVENESRAKGTVVLDKVYETASSAATEKKMTIARFTESPLKNSGLWQEIPTTILTKTGKPLAQAQIGYDDDYLYARINVEDETPLEHGKEETLAFKNGDSVSIVLGPKEAKPNGPGIIRLMATKVSGKAVLVAMKPVSKEKRPFEYETPAAGKAAFEFVGIIPEAKVSLNQHDQGYVASFAVPRSVLEFDLKAGESLQGDIEVRLSGIGQRGLQVTSRNYLFTPTRPETTMIDDIPTEARLYPQYWGPVEVK